MYYIDHINFIYSHIRIYCKTTKTIHPALINLWHENGKNDFNVTYTLVFLY
jgi:hypothetical protein